MGTFLGVTYVKLALWGALIVGIVGLLAYEHHKIDAAAYARAISDIRTANVKEDGMAAKGQVKVEDCFTSGGTWDRDNGTCTK